MGVYGILFTPWPSAPTRSVWLTRARLQRRASFIVGGALLALLGIAIGLTAGVTRFMSSMLLGVTPPIRHRAGVSCAASAGGVAGIIPASRAEVDPWWRCAGRRKTL
jgi:hypothetical protein